PLEDDQDRRSRPAGSMGGGAVSRMHRMPVLLLAVLLQLVSGNGRAADAPAAAPSPPRAAAATTVAETVARVVASENLQRAALARLEEIARWRELTQQIIVLEAEADSVDLNSSAMVESMAPIDLDRQMRALQRAATTIVGELEAIVRGLEHDATALQSDARNWQERLSFLEKQMVPAPVLERARSIEEKIRDTGARVQEVRDTVL